MRQDDRSLHQKDFGAGETSVGRHKRDDSAVLQAESFVPGAMSRYTAGSSEGGRQEYQLTWRT